MLQFCCKTALPMIMSHLRAIVFCLSNGDGVGASIDDSWILGGQRGGPGLTSTQPLPAIDPNQNRVNTGRFTSTGLHPGQQHRSLTPEIVVGIIKAIDFSLVLLAGTAAFAFYLGVALHSAEECERYILTSLFGATLFVAGIQYIGGYTVRQLPMLRWQLTRGAGMWAIVVAVLLFAAFVGKVSETYSRGWTLSWTLSALAFILIERGTLRLAIARWLRQGHLARNVVIVGAGEQGERLIAKLRQPQDNRVAICGVFDDRGSRVPHSLCGCEVLGNTEDLLDFARHVQVDEVIIALPLGAEQRIKAIVDKLKSLPIDLRLSAEPIADKLPVRGISYAGDVPLLAIVNRPIKHWNAVAKWVEDKVISAFLLLLFAPTMAIIALLIKLDSRGPVFFVQERFGFNNNAIRVLKFRTMHADRSDLSGAQRTVPNDPRVTRVGRVLRALSFDELPQLINVLRGDMSLVGPRPHAITMRAGGRLYYEAIEEYVHRHRVKPGITGWAQVNGLRGQVDTLEKARARVEYDLFYIENWSLWLDLKTLALTLPILLSRQNAY
jgi:Undecaprenyl-phosphate glucose phosphotransferase